MQDLEALLDRASWKQCEPLVKILNTNHCQAPYTREIVKGVKWLHRDFFSHFHREIFGKSESYADVLETILKKLNVSASASLGCEALEGRLTQTVFGFYWSQLTEPERIALAQRLEESAHKLKIGKEWKSAGGAAGLLAAGKIGGFGTYMLASSSLAGISGMSGIVLPFAAYTTLSSALAVALGPVGLTAAAVFGVYKLTGTNYQKLIPAALYIAALRYEIG